VLWYGSVTFTSAQTAGDFNVVGLVWSSAVTISSIVDTKGNTYTLAVGPTTSAAGASPIYYAKNSGAATAGSNSVTVTYSAETTAPDLRVAEYNGISTTTTAAGTGFTKRVISGYDGDILEDKIVTATGTYNATAATTAVVAQGARKLSSPGRL
jgi:hypothetical protein